MAVFQLQSSKMVVNCACCGRSNMFQHNDDLLTCNTCGYTFPTTEPVELVIEQVVTALNDKD